MSEASAAVSEASAAVSDWRGVPITPGAHVLYGAAHGRQVATVEAEVRRAEDGPMLTPSGRVWLRVQRRSMGGGVVGTPPFTHVSPSHLTVLGAPLPGTDLPTEADLIRREQETMSAAKAIEATHKITAKTAGGYRRECELCGAINRQLSQEPCTETFCRETIHV